MMRTLSIWLLGGCAAAALGASAQAGSGDQHPHRRVTISGGCQECDFAGQNLSDAMIIGARFDDSDFSHATLINAGLQECTFSDSNLNDANLTGARFSGVGFYDSDLSNAHLTGIMGDRVRFNQSVMDGADLSDSRLVLVSFEEAELSEAVLARVQLHHASFAHARLDRATFRDARLPRADFSGAEGVRVDFENADLRAANLANVRFERADFTGAQLAGANLSGASLIRARGLTAAQLSQACGDAETDLPGDLSVIPCPPRAPRPSGTVTVSRDGQVVQMIDTQRLIEAQMATVEALREVESRMPGEVQVEFRRSGELVDVRRAISEALEELRREEERAAARAERELARAERELERRERDRIDAGHDDLEVERREAELEAARARLEAMEDLMRDHQLPRVVTVPGTAYSVVVTPDGDIIANGNERYDYRWEFRGEDGDMAFGGELEGEAPSPPLPPKPGVDQGGED